MLVCFFGFYRKDYVFNCLSYNCTYTSKIQYLLVIHCTCNNVGTCTCSFFFGGGGGGGRGIDYAEFLPRMYFFKI